MHAVPLARFRGHGSGGQERILQPVEAENGAVRIDSKVRNLVKPCALRERLQNGHIALSSVNLVMMGSKVAKCLVKKGIEAAVVWYQVETFTYAVLDCRC